MRSAALHLHGVEALGALLHLVGDLVSFTDLVNGARLVDEDILAAIFGGDEPETFLRIEELHCTTCH